MGVSTDAYLAYGWFPPEDDPREMLGIATPDNEEDEEVCLWDLAEDEEWEKKFGIELMIHCSGDYQMPAFVLADSTKRASRGFPERIFVDDLVVDVAMLHTIVDFLKKRFNYDVDRAEVGWHLCSYRG